MSFRFPDTFARRMMSALGDEWPAFEGSHLQPPPVSIRLNPEKSLELTRTPVAWSEYGRYLPERPVFTLDPLFHAGTYYVQEASSMFLEQAFIQTVDNTKPLMVLDLCAAPGGKSTHLLSLMNDESLLISNEVIRSRVSVLTENLQKWGRCNVVVTNNDASDFQALRGFFDVIVVDAPCSGEGLFRKDPGAMDHWSQENVDLCSSRQQRILEDIWPALKEGGILIYSTCTYNEQENEKNLEWLSEKKDITPLRLDIADEWHVVEVGLHGIHGYHFYPHRVKGEGFFLSVVRKNEQEDTAATKVDKTIFGTPSKKHIDVISTWVTTPDAKFIQRDETIQLLPKRYADLIAALTRKIRVVYAGTYMAVTKHEKLIPEHALALSTILNKDAFLLCELSHEDAIRYLKKESIFISSDHKKGFALASHRGLPLGWMNILPGRVNNLYPSEWRIRMK
jgi:16S rRNA C967 or C1407 C5-methylase (RsmB/RsmF family)/NOL1/NOP2/fmu family ribosome biogenesis protein